MSDKPSRNNSRRPVPHKPALRMPNWWMPIASILILAAGLYRAIALRWVCDDAFITMRYVKNFVEGKGLVYNLGERVEGYTNFLWLLLLAASKAVGLNPVDASIWLGIAAYACILILLLAMSRREHKKNPKAIWLPLAAVLYALNYDAAVWASGGLETSFYALLILATFYLWFYSRFSEQRRLLLTGIGLALLALTRPDGVLFTAIAVLLSAARGRKWKQSIPSISKSIGILLLPSVIVGVPYLLWKYFYFGDLLPLTYYAKSANESYFGQGFFYVWLYLRVYFVSAIALIAAALLMLRKNKNAESNDDEHRGSSSITALTTMVVYLVLFVARVGGDFMFARFIIPVVPFIYFVIERGIDKVPYRTQNHSVIAMALLAVVIFTGHIRTNPYFYFDNDGKRIENWNRVADGSTRFISDERWYYYDHLEVASVPKGFMDIYSEVGKYYEPFFKGLSITVAIPGAMNMIAYYANFSTAINEYGLTDAYIAHLPLPVRGHIGHEKKAPNKYLRQQGANIELGQIVSKLPEQLHIDEIALQIPELGLWQLARVVMYDSAKMEELARRFHSANNGSIIPLYEHLIPYYVSQALPATPLGKLEEDYAQFRQLYFDRYPDSTLERPFKERITALSKDGLAPMF